MATARRLRRSTRPASSDGRSSSSPVTRRQTPTAPPTAVVRRWRPKPSACLPTPASASNTPPRWSPPRSRSCRSRSKQRHRVHEPALIPVRRLHPNGAVGVACCQGTRRQETGVPAPRRARDWVPAQCGQEGGQPLRNSDRRRHSGPPDGLRHDAVHRSGARGRPAGADHDRGSVAAHGDLQAGRRPGQESREVPTDLVRQRHDAERRSRACRRTSQTA